MKTKCNFLKKTIIKRLVEKAYLFGSSVVPLVIPILKHNS